MNRLEAVAHNGRMLTFGPLRATALLLAVATFPASGQSSRPPSSDPVDRDALARRFFGNDAPWYVKNVPFLDIDDPSIERTYYYRWQVYRSHLREIGVQGTVETEFLPSVMWARHPYEDLNDSSSFHILEGRWLRDPAYVASLVDHLYAGAGNTRQFTESVASATLAWTQVTGDTAPAVRNLRAMETIFNLWDDHFDASRDLYWTEPIADATEYTISSIDASGAGFTEPASMNQNDNGFFKGYAFRPSINAYQYGNARAIAALARVAGQLKIATDYDRRAERLREATLSQLWNPVLHHFTDIYQRSTSTVRANEFIRGRELVGYVPWQFELPPQHPAAGSPDYDAAWGHALTSAELAGPYGLRTVEPTYARYMHQYRYDGATGLPECQWNGPSWPFQTSQLLSGMANLLHDYPPAGVTRSDYVHLLRQYTSEHEIAPGKLDLEEDYDPDTGKTIVGLPRSHHYNHSTYNDLILSGLIGIRPHSDGVLELDPLLPPATGTEAPIRYFALEGMRYHGHDISILYDLDGSRYHRGSGLQVLSDGRLLMGPVPLGHVQMALPTRVDPIRKHPINLAVNVWARQPSAFEPDLPIASASSLASGNNLYEAVDGRTWFFPEIAHGWSPAPQPARVNGDKMARQEWFAVDLRHQTRIVEAKLAFFAEPGRLSAPMQVQVQAMRGKTWTTLTLEQTNQAVNPVANGETVLELRPVVAQQIRFLLSWPADGTGIRLVSAGVYEEK